MRRTRTDLALLAVIAVGGGIALARAPTIEEQEKQLGAGNPDSDRTRVLVGPDDATMGPADALVTIIWFGDFVNRADRMLFDAAWKVVKDHPDDVRLVYKHWPANYATSGLAHVASLAAGAQGRFWDYHSILYYNQAKLDRASLEDYADKLGLDMKAFRAAVDGGQLEAQVRADMAYGTRVGVTATPMLFVNGKLVMGAVAAKDLERVVGGELDHARELMKKKKLKRAAVYREIMRGARVGRAQPAASAPVRRGPDPAQTYAVPIGSSPQKGSPDAKLTVVMFTEFKCPFCARVQTTLADLEKKYGADIRFVWKGLIVHNNATESHLAAVAAAEQGRFWEMHDKLYSDWQHTDSAMIQRYAEELGLDMDRFREAISSGRAQTAVDADKQLAQQFAVTGVPGFFINGRHLSGAQPLDKFVALCDAELAEADALLQQGVAPADLYDTIVASGLPSVP